DGDDPAYVDGDQQLWIDVIDHAPTEPTPTTDPTPTTGTSTETPTAGSDSADGAGPGGCGCGGGGAGTPIGALLALVLVRTGRTRGSGRR
ncbi:MAG: hypothetical protein ABMB14_18450, partial [Myxococcota bacterium]